MLSTSCISCAEISVRSWHCSGAPFAFSHLKHTASCQTRQMSTFRSSGDQAQPCFEAMAYSTTELVYAVSSSHVEVPEKTSMGAWQCSSRCGVVYMLHPDRRCSIAVVQAHSEQRHLLEAQRDSSGDGASVSLSLRSFVTIASLLLHSLFTFVSLWLHSCFTLAIHRPSISRYQLNHTITDKQLSTETRLGIRKMQNS